MGPACRIAASLTSTGIDMDIFEVLRGYGGDQDLLAVSDFYCHFRTLLPEFIYICIFRINLRTYCCCDLLLFVFKSCVRIYGEVEVLVKNDMASSVAPASDVYCDADRGRMTGCILDVDAHN